LHEDVPALAERFVEPLRGENPPAPKRQDIGAPTEFPRAVDLPAPRASGGTEPSPTRVAQTKRGLGRNGLVSAIVVLALIPLTMLFVRLWQDTVASHAANNVPATAVRSDASNPATATALAKLEQRPNTLEVALSSPDRLEAKAGDVVAFPIAIDATGALPVRSVIAVTALPEGASFSEGRPYGITGWSLRPDEIADLQLHLPARSGATDMRLELVAGDGTVLAQSETRLSIAPSPAETAPAAIASNPVEQIASSEVTGSVRGAPPPPQRKPLSPAATDAEVKVNAVKVVAIPAPNPARPHDGGYGLGPAAEAPQAPAEWMVTKAAVDMHAKAEQFSETVKVADKGVKLKVTARDKNWVQVTDPKTSTTGWIYNRFLMPTDSAVQ
jgi:hypothetical protein